MLKECTEILLQLAHKALAEEQEDMEQYSGEEANGEEPNDASKDTEESESDTESSDYESSDHEESNSDELTFFTKLSKELKQSNAGLGARILCLFIPTMDKDLRETALKIFEADSLKDLCQKLYDRLRDFPRQRICRNLSNKRRRELAKYRSEVILTKYSDEMKSAKDHKRFYSYALLNIFSQLMNLKVGSTLLLFGRTAPIPYILKFDCPHRFALDHFIMSSFVNGIKMSK